MAKENNLWQHASKVNEKVITQPTTTYVMTWFRILYIVEYEHDHRF